MLNMPLHPKHAKPCTIKFYIVITLVMKWFVSQLACFPIWQKNIQMHELTSPDNNKFITNKIGCIKV